MTETERAQERLIAVKDPVCGMMVDPASSAGSGEYAGRTYHFCSTACLGKFRASPEKYAKADPHHEAEAAQYTCPMHPEIRQPVPGSCPKCGMALEAVQPAVEPGAEYTCPMHPEVVRSGPGSCPICGMALEPKIVTAGEEANPELADMSRRFWVSLLFALPVFLIAMGEMVFTKSLGPAIYGRPAAFAQLALATPVVAWGGWPFLQKGWRSLANRSLNMFTLIASASVPPIATASSPPCFRQSFLLHSGGTAAGGGLFRSGRDDHRTCPAGAGAGTESKQPDR